MFNQWFCLKPHILFKMDLGANNYNKIIPNS